MATAEEDGQEQRPEDQRRPDEGRHAVSVPLTLVTKGLSISPWNGRLSTLRRRTSRPGPARSAGGPGVAAALSRFGDEAQVFDYLAGRLDDAADGPGQGKAGLDRDPLTR